MAKGQRKKYNFFFLLISNHNKVSEVKYYSHLESPLSLVLFIKKQTFNRGQTQTAG